MTENAFGETERPQWGPHKLRAIPPVSTRGKPREECMRCGRRGTAAQLAAHTTCFVRIGLDTPLRCI